MSNRQTIAECVGGPCDGVQLDPSDPTEPDDWPDYLQIEDKETGVVGAYYFDHKQAGRPELRPGFRVYKFIFESLLPDE
jgi:hypothetical protein